MATRTPQQRADAARRAAEHPRGPLGQFLPRDQGPQNDAPESTAPPANDGDGQERPASGAATGRATEAQDETAGDPGEEAAGELTLVDQTVADLDGQPDDDAAPETLRANRKRLGRGPGRPKGAATTTKRAGPTRTANTTEKVVAAGKLDQKAVSTLLAICEGFMVPQLGDAARFAPNERQLIEPSLANILARMAPEQAAKFSAVADPLMLGTGLLMWALRVFNRPAAPPQPTGRPPVQLRSVGGTATQTQPPPPDRAPPPGATSPPPAPAAAAPDDLDAIQSVWSNQL